MLFSFSLVLVAITVAMHAMGMTFLLRVLPKCHLETVSGFWRTTALLVRFICFLVLLHIGEITVWAVFYLWQGCLPDAETAFYFSGVTYATVGFGDVVLPDRWRMLGPIEGLTGILMCSWSAALFFAVFSRLYHEHLPDRATPPRPGAPGAVLHPPSQRG